MRQRQRDELRRAQRLRHGPFGLRRARSRWHRDVRSLRRRAHQERGRDQQHPCGDADHEHREAPIIGRDQPACGGGDRQRRNAHAGRHQRDGEAAMLVDPGARKRHHRRIEAAGGDPDQHAEAELELPQALRLACGHQAKPEQQAAGQHHDAGAEAIRQRAPGERRKAHAEEIQRRRGRHPGARPAHRIGDRLQEHGERQHGAEADAGHQRARADDDPAIIEPSGLAHAFPRCAVLLLLVRA